MADVRGDQADQGLGGHLARAREPALGGADERAEEDAARIGSLKAICGEKDQEIAELRGYIRRVHEEDDVTSPLGEKAPAAEAPRTRLARDGARYDRPGAVFHQDGPSWVNGTAPARHWSAI